MLIRIVTYRARPGSDPGRWLEEHGEETRRIPGAGRTVYFQSTDDPSLFGAVMYFHTLEDLERYRRSEVHHRLVESLKERWMDDGAPVDERVLRVLEH